MENRTKNKQIKFRVTDKDYKKIKEKISKSKLNQDDYLLKCALGKEIKVIEGLPEMIKEVKRIGVNLNQLTKSVNQGRIIGTNQLEEMEKGLSEAWQLLRQLIQEQA